MTFKSSTGFSIVFFGFLILGNAMIFATAWFHYWPLLIFTVFCSLGCWASYAMRNRAKRDNL